MEYTQELLDKLGELIDSMDYEDDPEGKWGDEGIKYNLLQETAWEDEGRRSHKTMVFGFVDLEVFVQAELERTGDYYQGYEYEDTVFSFVTKHEKTVVKTYYKVVNL
ncbi:hypothetical protein XbC2_337 [Xanthomonas phage XbC2]|nr:hypothetical protein XbC2_337 [Xanthomonas phage XbC2]